MEQALPETMEWRALAAHAKSLGDTSIAAMFDADPDRLGRFSLDVAGIHFDFAKLKADARAIELLANLARAVDLEGWRRRLLAGETVNPTENRAATHTAERAPRGDRAKLRALVEAVRGGRHGDIRHILHIGIGGSALGPALLLDALARKGGGPEVAVVSNIDGVALEEALERFDPAHTLLVIVSKTFSTIETMTNAEGAIDWLRAAGISDPITRCIAVTAAPGKAREFGIADDRILPFAESVGGRYSLWSAVGLPFALRAGWPAFESLLAGAAAMDEHFAATDFEYNAPALAAAMDVWHATVLGAETRAVFAYDERLRLLPAYLQQLEMESNGKSVTHDGQPVTWNTAPITWGGTGTDAQHAVFQLLHQGTHLVPVEFLATVEPGHRLSGTYHRQLLANCFAQGAALMRGRSFEEALELSDGNEALAHAKTFPGNRPSSTILLDRLDPATLGALLAFYEHRTFSAAVLLGINAFDQMGVELGKEMAKAIDKGGESIFDPSTRDLMRRAFA